MQFTKEAVKLAKPVVEAIKFLSEKAGKSWKWKPKEGDRIILEDTLSGSEVYLLFSTPNGLGYDAGISCGRSTDYAREKYYDDFTQDTKDDCIPLLHWEDDIEPILERIHGEIHFQKLIHCFCRIIVRNSKFMQADGRYLEVTAKGKDRQISAMRAVIRLKKEMEK